MQMIPSEAELIEKMAEVIWEANDRKGATWAELLVLNSADGYLNAKTTVRIVRKQATAVLQALLESLPDDSKDIETQARNMQLQCIRDNPSAGAVPTIYHYEQQLQHLNKSAEYYKQLLNMRK